MQLPITAFLRDQDHDIDPNTMIDLDPENEASVNFFADPEMTTLLDVEYIADNTCIRLLRKDAQEEFLFNARVANRRAIDADDSAERDRKYNYDRLKSTFRKMIGVASLCDYAPYKEAKNAAWTTEEHYKSQVQSKQSTLEEIRSSYYEGISEFETETYAEYRAFAKTAPTTKAKSLSKISFDELMTQHLLVAQYETELGKLSNKAYTAMSNERKRREAMYEGDPKAIALKTEIAALREEWKTASAKAEALIKASEKQYYQNEDRGSKRFDELMGSKDSITVNRAQARAKVAKLFLQLLANPEYRSADPLFRPIEDWEDIDI